MKKMVFVSSVQKELEDERLIVQNLINTDTFLAAHCVPVLYEYEPASSAQATQECLATLESCQACLLIVWREYGSSAEGLSITHREYRCARDRDIPRLVFIRGGREMKREAGTETLLNEIDTDGLKYKRFNNVIELQREVREALVKWLKTQFGYEPTSDEDRVAAQTIEATSAFESQSLSRLRWQDLDHAVARQFVATAENKPLSEISDEHMLDSVTMRGLVWREPTTGTLFATAAGIVLLAPDPSVVFPQCRILADAYRGVQPDGDPNDHEDIRSPMPLAVERALAFIDRNTRHPMRVVGLNRVRLDEYPQEALREALVNALAHRQYEDAGRKVVLELFSDRIMVSSPGLPPAPLTVPILRSGRYRPCSRNPVLAQCLSFFHRIEERGSGFRRMKAAMEQHGLDPVRLSTDTGYFQIILPGPGPDMSRIKMPTGSPNVLPEVVASLSDRQKLIYQTLLESGDVSASRLEKRFKVSRPVITADLGHLISLGLLLKSGKGPSTRYQLADGKTQSGS